MQSPVEHIEISVSDQELRLLRGAELICSYPVSTSKFGTGAKEGSNKTPLGKFVIRQALGRGKPSGTIFKSRRDRGKRWRGKKTEKDLVLTRILRLAGLGKANANTFDRYIYIHGTNQEDLIGQPMSWGCIRMRNADVISLFDQVERGTEVTIRR